MLASVVAGSCMLLIVALLPVRQHSGRKYAFLGFVCAAFAVIGLVNLGISLDDLVMDGTDERVVKAQIGHMTADEATGLAPKNLIIIEGSSQTALGLDTRRVEQDLHNLGYDLSIVDLSIVGGNILERYTLEQRFSDEMRKHGLAYGRNTRLLFELNPEYDRDPLKRFAANEETLQAYYYSDLGNLLFAAHLYTRHDQMSDRHTVTALGDFLSHCLIWDFKIGFLPRMQRFDSLPEVSAFTTFEAPHKTIGFRHYDPEAIRQVGPLPDLAIQADTAHQQAKRVLELFGASASGYGFFFVPSRARRDMLFGHAFCQQHTDVPCIDASDPVVYAALDDRLYYYNRNHLSSDGARVYSDWFAQQLVTQQLVIK